MTGFARTVAARNGVPGRTRNRRAGLATAIAGATLLFSQAAFAADVPPTRTRGALVPVSVPFFTWNGAYGGIYAGYGFGHANWTSSLGPSTGNFNVSGATAGVTLGYNMQFNALVLGIEGDLGWSGIKGSSSSALCASGCQTRNTWLGSARGRIGYAFDRFLPFVSGGAAFGGLRIEDGGGAATANKAGWTLGGGLEYAFTNNWSARLDYHYVDLGKASCGAGCTAGAPFDVGFSTHLVRGGLNYRF